MIKFDFSKVNVSTGPSIKDIPVNTPVFATVTDVTIGTFNGTDKFVIQQDIYIDPDDQSKKVEFKTYIGPNMGWLLAQYLSAVGEDFRSLSGQDLSADALKSVLVGVPLSVSFKESTYQKDGETRHSKQLTQIRKVED